MVMHAVKREDLEAALMSSRKEAGLILGQVNFVQDELAKTKFVGEQAERLADEMNAKMRDFTAASYENVNELMRVIVNNMNVVVTKLGGSPWPHELIEAQAANNAAALRISGNTDYEIDTDEMTAFASKVDEWFEAIATSYNNVRGTVSEGTPSWQGPEKTATVDAVNTAIEQILGSAGDGDGTGVRGVGASLSGWLREQVAVMEGGAV
ncbi:MAG: hypothetical protein AAF547_07475 [Actinomycetota bacterium]